MLAETVLGKAIKTMPIPRESFVVSTKCGRYGSSGFDFSAERVTRSVDESLERLNLDYVDIIICHDIEYGSLDQVLNFPLFDELRYSVAMHWVTLRCRPLWLPTVTRKRLGGSFLSLLSGGDYKAQPWAYGNR